VIATMWMSSAPATATTPPPGATPPGAIPAIAGGSPELDEDSRGANLPANHAPLSATSNDTPIASELNRQPEIAFVAILAGAATIVFGIIPQPLFDLVHGVGSALGLL
jgi:hypothetical protein